MCAVDLNAVTRSLDLACKILSPPIAGAIMTYGSRLVSAIVIAAWNIVSLIAEYTILSHVYRLVPALSVKQSTAITGWLDTDLHILCTQTDICHLQTFLCLSGLESVL